ncbi:protein-glutamate O-methyltransferase CheR [Tautonia sociabilis]|uniref:Uncharacterized protein n=1 Tax=Tautonia sociabilis TaxID=2080755 RepID=A0A432ME26_9BACT|nr:hypothetical protein TsocGM_22325 [Tautonia sociabilis]
MSVWSAASRGGDELDSALITLAEDHELPLAWQLLALGIDISGAALALARKAIFSKRSL